MDPQTRPASGAEPALAISRFTQLPYSGSSVAPWPGGDAGDAADSGLPVPWVMHSFGGCGASRGPVPTDKMVPKLSHLPHHVLHCGYRVGAGASPLPRAES